MTKDSSFSQPNYANYDGFSGSVADLAVAIDGNRAWLVAVNSGLWQTENFGDDHPTWAQVMLPSTVSLSCVAIEEDPNNGQTYIAVGSNAISTAYSLSSNSYVGKMMKSMDGGLTWKSIDFDGNERQGLTAIAITNQGQTVIGAVNNWPLKIPGSTSGLWISENDEPAYLTAEFKGQALHVVKNKYANEVYALFNDGRVLYSSDGFRSSRIAIRPPQGSVKQGIEFTRGQLTFQYIGGAANNIVMGFLATTDGPGSVVVGVQDLRKGLAQSVYLWKNAPEGLMNGQGQFHGTVTACDTKAGYVYMAGKAVEAKNYAGNVLNIMYFLITLPEVVYRKYSQENFVAHPDSKKAVTVNGAVYFCGDGGCFRSRNPMADESKVSWNSIAANLPNIECYAGGFDPQSGTASCCAQDNGCLTYLTQGDALSDTYQPAIGPEQNWVDHLGDGASAAVFPGAGPDGGPGVLVSHQYLYDMRQVYGNMTKITDLAGCGGFANGFDMVPRTFYNYFLNGIMIRCQPRTGASYTYMIYQFEDGIAKAFAYNTDAALSPDNGVVIVYGHPTMPSALYFWSLDGGTYSLMKTDVKDPEYRVARRYVNAVRNQMPVTMCVHPADDSHVIYGTGTELFSVNNVPDTDPISLGTLVLSQSGKTKLLTNDCEWHHLEDDRYVVHLTTNAGLYIGESILNADGIYDVPLWIPMRFNFANFDDGNHNEHVYSFMRHSHYFQDTDTLVVVSQGQGVQFMPDASKAIKEVLDFKITKISSVESRRRSRGGTRALDLSPLKMTFNKDVVLSKSRHSVGIFSFATEEQTVVIDRDRMTTDGNELTIVLEGLDVPTNTLLGFYADVGAFKSAADETVYYGGAASDESTVADDLNLLGELLYFGDDSEQTKAAAPTEVSLAATSQPNTLDVMWVVDNMENCVFLKWDIMLSPNDGGNEFSVAELTTSNLYNPDLRTARVKGLYYGLSYMAKISQKCMQDENQSDYTESRMTASPISPPAEKPIILYYPGPNGGKDITAHTVTLNTYATNVFACSNPMMHLELLTILPTGLPMDIKAEPQPLTLKNKGSAIFFVRNLNASTIYAPLAMISCDETSLNSDQARNWDQTYFTTLSEKCPQSCGLTGVCRNGMCQEACEAPDPCCSTHDAPTCGNVLGNAGAACVCKIDPFCCAKDGHWDHQCTEELQQVCNVKCD